jgi:hypothetical protein
MIDSFYYDEQIRTYLLQFCAIFSGLKIKTGKGQTGQEEFISVPIHIGNKDRVVAAIIAGNTHNKMFSLPILSANIQSIELAPERRKGINVVDNRVFMQAGGVFPDDLRIASRVMPIPYNLGIELAIYSSNTLQLHQILEQILMLFDPTLQIQTTDKPFDWTKITTVELTGINNEENYPVATERRIIVWTLNFMLPIWISPPMDIKDEVVRKIIIRIGDLDGFNINEFDENGELQPFETVYSTSVVEG